MATVTNFHSDYLELPQDMAKKLEKRKLNHIDDSIIRKCKLETLQKINVKNIFWLTKVRANEEKKSPITKNVIVLSLSILKMEFQSREYSNVFNTIHRQYVYDYFCHDGKIEKVILTHRKWVNNHKAREDEVKEISLQYAMVVFNAQFQPSSCIIL